MDIKSRVLRLTALVVAVPILAVSTTVAAAADGPAAGGGTHQPAGNPGSGNHGHGHPHPMCLACVE